MSCCFTVHGLIGQRGKGGVCRLGDGDRVGLRALTGLDHQVRDFVLDREECSSFVLGLVSLLETVLPHYAAEGKSYLTIAIGCTGGHHRSVAVAEEVGRRLRLSGQPVRVSHRDIIR